MYTDPEWGMHATKIINITRYETDRKFLLVQVWIFSQLIMCQEIKFWK